jgi:hypothetical protein
MKAKATAMRVGGNKEDQGSMAMAPWQWQQWGQWQQQVRVAGKDEGDDEGGKRQWSNGNKEGNCEEEGNGNQQWQQEDGNWDNNNNHNDNGNKNSNNDNNADSDNKDTAKMTTMTVQRQRLAVVGGGGGGQWRRWRRGLSLHIFYWNWILGVVSCWQGAGEAGGMHTVSTVIGHGIMVGNIAC